MDNPCFEEEARKGVYTIEEESRRTRAPQHHHYDKPGGARKEGPKVATLAASILLATLIVLASTAALVYTLRTVNTSYKIGKASMSSSWASEMIVSGEFRIINEPFRPALYNLSSSDFKQLSGRIGKQLEELFLDSTLWSEVRNVAVTGLSPGLQVRCSMVLQPQDSLTIGKLGLAFLAGLNHSHGHLWLGPFTVDVLSIGFQASTEEVSWSQWSDWSECSLYKNGRLVRTRRRVCLTLEGLKLSRAEPCKAISKIGMNDTEIESCLNMTLPVNFIQPKIRETTRTSEPSTSRTTNRPSTTTEFSWSQIVTKQPEQSRLQTLPTSISASVSTMTPSTTSVRNVANKSEEVSSTSINVPVKGWCGDCSVEEVCVALDMDPVPICRPSLDPSDPTGCGGLCRINTEICHRLGPYAYRCIDDSKCLDNEWQCGNTLCIPSIKRCDGHFNCYDHTDEHNCECNLNTHFQCGKNLSCLPLIKKCDGIVDCWDAADESNCTIACLDETQFTCNDSQCIPSKNFCDGFVDCKDHSDEPFGCGGVCKNHEWRCSNGRCIVKRDVCNGMDDCGDGSDEIKCGKRRFTTHSPDSK